MTAVMLMKNQLHKVCHIHSWYFMNFLFESFLDQIMLAIRVTNGSHTLVSVTYENVSHQKEKKLNALQFILSEKQTSNF
jgi:hypothetical protein